ncbi:hypothetical protein HPB47_022876 [Ixodes persulcatus]|uniref:Uncharacterized protein n=1 Tax=Ixodes persulcatus TaxID=34615 RepID=A0AC60Q9M6_IXOPE|nr:hypothetical protein HPB47_022876 [Ixodes persulcatus]
MSFLPSTMLRCFMRLEHGHKARARRKARNTCWMMCPTILTLGAPPVSVAETPSLSIFSIDDASTPRSVRGTRGKEETRFPCDICLKDFSTAYTMRRHRAIHNPNFLKHQCDFCPRSFTWIDNLRSHLQGVHGVVPFAASLRGSRGRGDHGGGPTFP